MLESLPPVKPVAARIAGTSGQLPIRRIYCVGRNYLAHAREMGADEREPPFFFTKFPDTLAPTGSTLAYPSVTADFHYEGELVIAMGKEAFNVTAQTALDHVLGYAAGLDMTRRDLQLSARDKGRPWDMGKNFSQSAVLAPIALAGQTGPMTQGALVLKVNGEVKQQADLADLIWSCAEIIAHLSTYDRLMPGDLIYTGTPAGVGAVKPGDQVDLSIEGLAPLSVTIGASAT